MIIGKKIKTIFNKRTTSKLIIAAFLFVVIVIPIVRMLFNINLTSIKSVFGFKNFYDYLLNSFTSTILASIITIVIGYSLAWSINRTNLKFKNIFSLIITLPMLIPSISHGMGLIILFGNNGIITKLFGLSSTIYGFWGVVLGSVIYSFPIAFIMILDILKYEDHLSYEAADVLGISKIRQFTSITLPYMRKPMISVAFAVFTMIVTDYGVPLSVGGKFKTLPVMLYEESAGQLNYSVGSVIGLVLLIPAIVAFVFDLSNKDKGKNSFVQKEYQKRSIKNEIIGYLIVGITSAFVLLIIFSFMIQAFVKSYPSDLSFTWYNFKNTFSKNGGKYLVNSIIISLLTSIIGVLFSGGTAYLTVRLKSHFSKLLHLMAIMSLSIPGLVLGLSYVILFKSTFFYGTIIILIMVNTVHFLASPYLMIYNAFGKLNENLEDVGHVLGIKRKRIIFDVIVPQCKNTFIEMFSYFFVNSMMTISAVAFLATSSNKPISLLINQFETYNMMESAAVVALLILASNLALKGLLYLIKKVGNKHDNKKTI